jgi:Tol biopolymer transport system component
LKGLATSSNGGIFTWVSWSPDGNRIAVIEFGIEEPIPHDNHYNLRSAIYVMNADGSGLKQLFKAPIGVDPKRASWSPDGTQLMLEESSFSNATRSLDIINSTDGSGLNHVNLSGLHSNGADIISNSEWSPDGKKIALTATNKNYTQTGIYMMNIDGSDVKLITQGYSADLSPDGKKFVFGDSSFQGNVDIYVVNADGSERKKIIDVTPSNTHAPLVNPVEDIFFLTEGPEWSPDGTKVVFQVTEYTVERDYYTGAYTKQYSYQIFTANSDGSDLRKITSGSQPSWGTNTSTVTPVKYSTLEITTTNLKGVGVGGVWTTIRNSTDGTVIETGYTPMTFTGFAGKEYRVTVANYDGKVFSKWQDNGSTSKSRIVKLSSPAGANIIAATLTAVYDTGNSLRGFTPLTYAGATAKQQQPSLTVNAVTMEGNKTLQMWTTIDPLSTTNSSGGGGGGAKYKVYATNGYQNLTFDHWGDNGSTDRVRTLTIDKNTTITAYYKMG